MPALWSPGSKHEVGIRTYIPRSASFSRKLGAVLGVFIGVFIVVILLLVMCRSSKDTSRSRRTSTVSGRSPRSSGPRRPPTRKTARPRSRRAVQRRRNELRTEPQPDLQNSDLPILQARNHPSMFATNRPPFDVAQPAEVFIYPNLNDGINFIDPMSNVHIGDTSAAMRPDANPGDHGSYDIPQPCEENQNVFSNPEAAPIRESVELRLSMHTVAQIQPSPSSATRTDTAIVGKKQAVSIGNKVSGERRVANQSKSVVSPSRGRPDKATPGQPSNTTVNDNAFIEAGGRARPLTQMHPAKQMKDRPLATDATPSASAKAAARKDSNVNSLALREQGAPDTPSARNLNRQEHTDSPYSGANVLRNPPPNPSLQRYGTWSAGGAAGSSVQMDMARTRAQWQDWAQTVNGRTTIVEGTDEEDDTEADEEESDISLPELTLTESRPRPDVQDIPKDIMRRYA